MKPYWRWTLIGLGVAAGLGVLGAGAAVITARSQAILDARHPGRPSAVHAAASPEAVARGAHLVLVTDCTACHGKSLSGALMTLSGSPIYASNLAVLSKTRTDAELDRAIRQGLRPDGRSELAMPSQAYAALSDEEVAAIIAYLRTLPPGRPVQERPPLGLMLRANLAVGALKTEAARVAEARAPLDAGPGFEAGRHLAAISCGQCHGTDLAGGRDSPGPDLTVRGYYDRKQFTRLMREGEGIGEHMELMSQTALASFTHFTDAEIGQIYDYLIARDERLSGKKPS